MALYAVSESACVSYLDALQSTSGKEVGWLLQAPLCYLSSKRARVVLCSGILHGFGDFAVASPLHAPQATYCRHS